MHRSIGIDAQNCRSKIVNDGFDSIRAVVRYHKDDISGFKTYLMGLNKTFASSNDVNLRVYYSPVCIARMLGVVHFYNQAVNTFHCIPDPSYINRDYADTLASTYKSFENATEKAKDEVEVTLPPLTGSSNWIDFWDKFMMKLTITIGSRGISLYLETLLLQVYDRHS